MRVRERYPIWMRFYSGGGFWRLALPARYVASKVYGSYMNGKGSEIPARRSGRVDDGGAMVVSVGNIEVGGVGKTPCVIAMADELRKRGEEPVIVTRGYRSEAERRGPFVVTAGRPIDSAALSFIEAEGLSERMIGGLEMSDLGLLSRTVGDEPTLFASRGIPTVISRDRRKGIRIAIRIFGAKRIILDDAFQNLSVERDLDILLLDWRKPFGNGGLIPMGSLRERPEAVGRADCVIFTRAKEDIVPSEIGDLLQGKPVFYSHHKAMDLIDADGEIHSLERLSGERVVLFSGIARPQSFEETVRSIGADPAISFRFADHHCFRRRDVRWMEREIEPGLPIVTTEKDLAKAAGLFSAGTRLLALRLRMEIGSIDSLIGLLDQVDKISQVDRTARLIR